MTSESHNTTVNLYTTTESLKGCMELLTCIEIFFLTGIYKHLLHKNYTLLYSFNILIFKQMMIHMHSQRFGQSTNISCP